MSDPACQKQRERRGIKALRTIGANIREVIAGMVQSHHDHHQAAKDVDGIKTGANRNGSLLSNRRNFGSSQSVIHGRSILNGKSDYFYKNIEQEETPRDRYITSGRFRPMIAKQA